VGSEPSSRTFATLSPPPAGESISSARRPYLGNTSAFTRDLNEVPDQLRQRLSPQTLDQIRGFSDRFSRIAKLIDDDQVYLPFTVVHAERVD
jgi:hypothetical protein